MQKKFVGTVLMILAILFFVLSISAVFICFRPTVDIADTKLQYYEFKSYENGMISCTNNRKLVIPEVLQAEFDADAFSALVKEDKSFFARVDSNALRTNETELTAYAVVIGQKEFVSLERLNELNTDTTLTGALILIAGLVFTIVFGSLAVYQFKKSKKPTQ